MPSPTLAELPGLVGRDFGPTPYLTIDQSRIDAFAACTDDAQWIHVDPERAAYGPFGTTVAHGYLTLSLLVKFVQDLEVLPDGLQLVVNYGLNKVRFPAPVASGSRVRCSATLSACEEKGEGRTLITLDCVVEVEGGKAPALVAQVLYLLIA